MGNKRWVSFKKYIGACLYFNKITTGNAVNNTWNIKESKLIQNTLAKIMDDDDEQNNDVPEYIRVLFRNYCIKHEKPLFYDLDRIQWKMTAALQQHLFDDVIHSQPEPNKNDDARKQKISHEKIKLLFPNATHYKNERKELISMIEIK